MPCSLPLGTLTYSLLLYNSFRLTPVLPSLRDPQEIEAFMFGSQFRAPPKRISSLKESDTNVTLGKKVCFGIWYHGLSATLLMTGVLV